MLAKCGGRAARCPSQGAFPRRAPDPASSVPQSILAPFSCTPASGSPPAVPSSLGWGEPEGSVAQEVCAAASQQLRGGSRQAEGCGRRLGSWCRSLLHSAALQRPAGSALCVRVLMPCCPLPWQGPSWRQGPGMRFGRHSSGNKMQRHAWDVRRAVFTCISELGFFLCEMNARAWRLGLSLRICPCCVWCARSAWCEIQPAIQEGQSVCRVPADFLIDVCSPWILSLALSRESN